MSLSLLHVPKEQVIRLSMGATNYVNLNHMTVTEVIAPVQLNAGWNLIGCPIEGSTNIKDTPFWYLGSG